MKGFLRSDFSSLHLHGPPSDARLAIFACLLRELLTKWSSVTVLDSGMLAQQHFDKTRVSIRLKPSPYIFMLGREIEPKIGIFYFRTCLEYAVPRSIPFVLVSDFNPTALSGRYPEFSQLARYANFRSMDVRP